MTETAAAALALVTVDQAIGKGVANGTAGMIAPSVHIADDIEELAADGVRTVTAMSTELLLDFLGLRLDSRKAADMSFVINLVTPVNVSTLSGEGKVKLDGDATIVQKHQDSLGCVGNES